MTTYRKDVKKEQVLLKNSDAYYQNEVRDYLTATHTRVNCLVGFTVIAILIGCAALAISTLLLLQKFEMASEETARFEELQMRIKYLERLTESLELAEGFDKGFKGAQKPPQPPQPQQTPQPPQPPQSQPQPKPVPQPPQTPPPHTLSPTPTLPPITTTLTPAPQPPLPTTPPPPPRGRKYDDVIIATQRPPFPPDDEDAEGGIEGSGGDCPLNPPRPLCPIGMLLCTTKERCPKYVCCR